MPLPKKNSLEITKRDGRRNNGAKKGEKRGNNRQGLIKATNTNLNKAKKERRNIYAINAIRSEFASEQEAWAFLAKKSREDFKYFQMLWTYAYGKPDDVRDVQKNSGNAPVINFFANSDQIKHIDNTIDIIEDIDE